MLKSGSDCEIISHLYLKYGMSGLLQMLDGYYCFVLYDSRSDTTYAARDYFGVRPMFQGINSYDAYAFHYLPPTLLINTQALTHLGILGLPLRLNVWLIGAMMSSRSLQAISGIQRPNPSQDTLNYKMNSGRAVRYKA